MLEKLRNIFQVPELKRRIIFTLALFVVYRLGEHRFAVGEYLSITDEDGRLLTYKVTDVAAA